MIFLTGFTGWAGFRCGVASCKSCSSRPNILFEFPCQFQPSLIRQTLSFPLIEPLYDLDLFRGQAVEFVDELSPPA
jgi:hypothetical protein